MTKMPTRKNEKTTGMKMSVRSGYKPYPVYKDSGVEWLGEMPEGWNAPAIGRRYSVQLGKMLDAARLTGLSSFPYLRNADVQWDNIATEELPVMDFTEYEREKYALRPGDLLVCEGGDLGRAAIWKGELETCFFQKAIHRLRPLTENLDNPRFLFYFLRYVNQSGILASIQDKATISHFTAEMVRAQRFPSPPREEQILIVKYLDAHFAKLDALLAKYGRLLELLAEKRSALITRAVTKGLDPKAPMKDSGVEWLGDIPEGWQTYRLWVVSKATSGGTPDKDNLEYWNGSIPWVSPKDMKVDRLEDSEDHVSARAISENGLKLIAPESVLVVVRGMILIRTLPVSINSVPVTINQDMKALRFNSGLSAEYMQKCLQGIEKHILTQVVEEAAHGTQAIRMDKWRAFQIPVPPDNVQIKIVDVLNRETAKLDALVAKVEKAVELLKERRVALISAAVTGKIDLREEVP